MRRELYDAQGATRLDMHDATPECGEDFCDRCGDCLACYNGDGCYNPDGEWDADYPHRWVVYEGD